MVFYLLVIGFVTILGQVVILRELQVAFHGVELIYILSIGIWLLWTSVGAVLGKRTYVPAQRTVEYLFVLFGLCLIGDVVLIRGLRRIWDAVPGSFLDADQQLVSLVTILLPIGVLSGLLFQWEAGRYTEKGKTFAHAYGVESVGGVFGGSASTILLIFHMQNFKIGISCALACVVSVFSVHLFSDQTGGRTWMKRIFSPICMLCLICICLFIILLAAGDRLDQHMTRWTHPRLVDSKDTPYGRVTITGRAGQLVVFENNVFSFETQGTDAEEFVHMAALQHPSPREILLAGGGAEGLLIEILKHYPRHVDYVEINAGLIEMTKHLLPDQYTAAYRSPAVNVYHGDPRQFIKTAPRYDLILVGMAQPETGQSNRFYTREYFLQCKKHLNAGGILALRLRSSENIRTHLMAYKTGSIYRALTSVFEDVVVLPGITDIYLASDKPLDRDPGLPTHRLKQRNIDARLVSPEYIAYVYTNDRFQSVARRLEGSNAPVNTDIRPVCYRISTLIWLSRFFSDMIHRKAESVGMTLSDQMIRLASVITILSILFISVRRQSGLKRIVTAVVAGFLGMMSETVLLVYYQAESGVLFQNIGVLLMVFMAGLAFGGLGFAEGYRRYGGSLNLKLSLVGKGLMSVFGVVNLLYGLMLHFQIPIGMAGTGGFLFVSGILVSGVLSFAGSVDHPDQKQVISPLYSADLAGGCIAAMAGTLMLIPVLGMVETSVLMAAVALCALLLV